MKRIDNALIFAAFTAVLLGNGKETGFGVAAEDGAAMDGQEAVAASQDSRRDRVNVPEATEVVARR